MTADSDGKALLLLCCYAFDTRAGAWPRDVAAHTHGMFRRKRATGVTQKLPTTVWKRTVASRGRVDAVVTVMPASVIVSIDTFTLTAWRQKGSGDSQMRTFVVLCPSRDATRTIFHPTKVLISIITNLSSQGWTNTLRRVTPRSDMDKSAQPAVWDIIVPEFCRSFWLSDQRFSGNGQMF